MEPTIKSGSVVLIRQWWVRPRIGDVVVFKMGRDYWVKRIKFVKGSELIVEGDNKADSLDTTVGSEQVVGKVLLY